jgi:hypothetical protein
MTWKVGNVVCWKAYDGKRYIGKITKVLDNYAEVIADDRLFAGPTSLWEKFCGARHVYLVDAQ